VVNVQGGVNLLFDAGGKLVDNIHSEITQQTVADEIEGNKIVRLPISGCDHAGH
jgi:hypothetical protein